MAALLPSKETMIECMDLASTPEAAAYFYQQFKALLVERRLDKRFEGLLKKCENFAEEVQATAESATNPWRGELPLPDYANASVQRAQATEKDKPTTPVDKVLMGIEFAEGGELNRGYMLNDKPADAEAIARLDVSFHAWFARNGMLFRAPYLYEASENGEIKTGENGQPLRVELNDFQQAVEAKNDGLKAYFNQHVKGVAVDLVQVKLPAQYKPAPEGDIAPAA
ncbi:MAG: hypothetical protein P1U39_08695 [Legionellaceae bacterium]|nr:hypothetical protein [Legionellaceae bacterium]